VALESRREQRVGVGGGAGQHEGRDGATSIRRQRAQRGDESRVLTGGAELDDHDVRAQSFQDGVRVVDRHARVGERTRVFERLLEQREPFRVVAKQQDVNTAERCRGRVTPRHA